MHFKDNQIAKESLETIADHFRKIARRSMTPEQLLGFKRDTPYFVINRRYVSDIQRDFTNLVIVSDLIDKFVDTDKSITNINLFTRSLKNLILIMMMRQVLLINAMSMVKCLFIRNG